MSAPVRITDAAPLDGALAEELRLASRMLADLAFDLGSDAETLRRHVTSLQQIDHVTQMLLTVAELLSVGHEAGLACVTLEDMAERLRHATAMPSASSLAPASSISA